MNKRGFQWSCGGSGQGLGKDRTRICVVYICQADKNGFNHVRYRTRDFLALPTASLCVSRPHRSCSLTKDQREQKDVLTVAVAHSFCFFEFLSLRFSLLLPPPESINMYSHPLRNISQDQQIQCKGSP